MNGNGHECSTSMDMDTAPDLTDPAAEKGVASTLSTMMPAATAAIAVAAVGKGDVTMDAPDDIIPNIHKADAEQVAAWASRQLASPVHLQSLRIVYDTLVDRQHHNQAQYHVSPSEQQRDETEQQNHLIRALLLTCQLLLEIHRECESTVQQQVLTTSQQHCIETTERRSRWLLELVTGTENLDNKKHAADDHKNLPGVVPVGGSDSSDRAGNSVITNLCRRPAINESSGHTEWTYDYVAAKDDNDNNSGNVLPTRAQYASEVQNLRDGPGYKNDNDTADDHDDDEDENDGGSNMLPSRAELAAEERMLWRMADTPIPSETYGVTPIPSIYDK